MRAFLDSILDFINSESLTDLEFEGMELPESPGYTQEIYTALKLVLEGRESVSGATKRLKLFFIAKGVDLTSPGSTPTPKSQIYIGDGL